MRVCLFIDANNTLFQMFMEYDKPIVLNKILYLKRSNSNWRFRKYFKRIWLCCNGY